MIRLVYADGPSSPRIGPAVALDLAGVTTDRPHVVLGWTLEAHPWLDDPNLSGVTYLGGYGLAGAIADGRITPLPVRLSAVPTILESEPPDVGVIAVVTRGGGYAFSGSVGWGDVLAHVADRLVVEVDEHGVDLGGPTVRGNVVAEVPRPTSAGALGGQVSPGRRHRPSDRRARRLARARRRVVAVRPGRRR